jgi:hypothetical protein
MTMNNKVSPILARCDSSFDDPGSSAASGISTSVQRRSLAVRAVRTDEIDLPLGRSNAMLVRIVRSIRDRSCRTLQRSTLPTRRDLGLLNQRYFRRRGPSEPEARRNSLPVCHRHSLCFAVAVGLSDAERPLFAARRLASTRVSSLSTQTVSSRSGTSVREIWTHTCVASQAGSPRRHVLGDGHVCGRSLLLSDRVRRTQSTPSRTRRWATGLRHPLGEIFRFGNRGSIRVHCWSVSNGLFLAMATPFARHDHVEYRACAGARLYQGTSPYRRWS